MLLSVIRCRRQRHADPRSAGCDHAEGAQLRLQRADRRCGDLE